MRNPQKRHYPVPCALQTLEDRRYLSLPTFSAPVVNDTNSVPAIKGDVNGDGNPDVITGSVNSIDVELSSGTGLLSPFIDSPAIVSLPVAVTDVNGDGLPDIITAGTQYGQGDRAQIGVESLLGNGKGNFSEMPLSPLAPPPSNSDFGSEIAGAVAGAFGPDGRIGVAVLDSSADTVDIFLGNGDGTFAAPTVISTIINQSTGEGDAVSSMAIGDFSGNGEIQLIVAASGGDAVGASPGILEEFTSNGNGVFSGPTVVDHTNAVTEFISAADLTGSGKTDLFSVSPTKIAVFLNTGSGFAETDYPTDGGYLISNATAARFTGGTEPDIAVYDGANVVIFVNNGNGDFQNGQVLISDAGGDRLLGVNLIKGGMPDIVATNPSFDGDYYLNSVQLPPVVSVSSGVATVVGTPGPDGISVDQSQGSDFFGVNDQSESLPASGITQIIVEGLGGNDSITIENVSAAVYGGGGADTITAFGSDPETLNAGLGRDSITGSNADCMLIGGDGADTLRGAGAGDNQLYGGLGSDRVFAANSFADTIFGGGGSDTAHIDAGLDQIPDNDVQDIIDG